MELFLWVAFYEGEGLRVLIVVPLEEGDKDEE